MSVRIDIKCPICGEVLNIGFVAHMIQVHMYRPEVARKLYLRTVKAECAFVAEMIESSF